MWETIVQFVTGVAPWLILFVGFALGVGASFLWFMWQLARNWA